MASSPTSCLQRNDWICGEYLTTRADLIASSTLEHVVLTAVSVAIGLAVALPAVGLAALAGTARFSRAAFPAVLLLTVLDVLLLLAGGAALT